METRTYVTDIKSCKKPLVLWYKRKYPLRKFILAVLWMHKCFLDHHHTVFSCYPPSPSVSPSLKIPQVSGLEEKQPWLTFSSRRLYTNWVLALQKHITAATDLKALTEERHLLKRKMRGRKKERGSKGQGEGYRGVLIAESWIFSTFFQLDLFLHELLSNSKGTEMWGVTQMKPCTCKDLNKSDIK